MKSLSVVTLGFLALSLAACPKPITSTTGSGGTKPICKGPECYAIPEGSEGTNGTNGTTDNADVNIIYPTVLIEIPEFHFSRFSQVPLSAAETQFTNTFNTRNFKVLDKKQAEKVWKDDVLFKMDKEEDITAAASLAFKSGADILIIGEAFSEKGVVVNTGGVPIYTCAARLDVKIIKASNGQILAAESFTSKGADTTELTAATKATDAASKELSGKMATTLKKIWDDPRNRTIEIIVSAPNKGFTLKEAETFRKGLVKDVSGVSEVVMREFNEGAAPMEVSYNGDAQGLSGAIDGKKVGGRKCTVTKMQEGKIFVNVE
jgi:hypothetical protein